MSAIATQDTSQSWRLSGRLATALALIAFASVVVSVVALMRSAEDADGGGRPVMESGGSIVPQLEMHLKKHPRDARAWVIYARLEFARGSYATAAQAYARAVELPGKVARDPLVWCEYADALAMAAGGRLDGKPRELISHALALDEKNIRALEMAGSVEVEAGNYAQAVAYWEKLLAVLPGDAPERAELTRAVERARMRAGR